MLRLCVGRGYAATRQAPGRRVVQGVPLAMEQEAGVGRSPASVAELPPPRATALPPEDLEVKLHPVDCGCFDCWCRKYPQAAELLVDLVLMAAVCAGALYAFRVEIGLK